MPKIAFLFPGQGAQSVGMARAACEESPEARELFRRASEILGYDLPAVCAEGPEERLNSTAVSQPAIFVSSLAAVEKLRREDPESVRSCAGAAGLSLGEYTALVFAGAMSFEDGLRTVQIRGEAMQRAAEAAPSSMASVLGLAPEALERVVGEASRLGYVRIANYLCPGNLVVSGETAAVEEAGRLASAAGAIQVVPLAVAGAFHTDLMKPADQALARALEAVSLSPPRIPVYSNVDAQPHADPQEIKDLLVRQVLSQVRWDESMRRMLADGYDKFFELGPGRVLASLMKRIQRRTDVTNVVV